ncbi:MAG: hypothetical protein NZ700_14915 [Gemmataceae bacterium]|nr:hypothetical protein [Gemmataceae bacterium]MDW8265704.1 hypothetical protein [Gemmataceae bacterium]
MRYLTTTAAAVGVFGLAVLLGQDRSAASDPAGWGTVKGQIVFGGDTIPQPKIIEAVNNNQDKAHCLSKGPLYAEDWVVNKENKGVRDVFVWLATEPDAPVKTLPIHPDLKTIKEKQVVMDQPCCMFIPHALGLREGQVLLAKNSAPVAHNVNFAGFQLTNPGRNVLVPPGKEFAIEGLRADEKFPVTISCNIHPWMRAVVRVYNHPYFAVTDVNGQFEIAKAPAGNFRLKIWHDAVGWRGGAAGRAGEKISIAPNTVTEVKFDLKP